MSGIINHIMSGTSSNSRRSNSNSRIRHPVVSTTTTTSTTPTSNINGMNHHNHNNHNTIPRFYNTTTISNNNTTTYHKRKYCCNISMKYMIGICISIIFIIFIIVQHIMISILYNHNENDTIHSHLQIQVQQQYKNSIPSTTTSTRIINEERNVEQHDHIDLYQLDETEWDIITYKESKYINCDLLSMPTIHNIQKYQQHKTNQKKRRIQYMIYNLCYNITTTTATTSNNNNNNNNNIRQFLFYNPLENVKRYVCYNNNNNNNNNNHNNNDKDDSIPLLGKTYVTIESSKCYNTNNNNNNNVQLQPTYRLFSVQPIELDSTTQDLTTTTTTNTIQQLAKHQIPIETSFGSKPTQLFDTCDIPCLYDGPPNGVLCTRTIINTPDTSIWKITFSMEGPQYYNTLYINTNAYKENHFYSTTSYNSDIPLPYYSRAEYNIYHNHYVPYNTGIKGAVFLARNCGSMNNREQIVSDMINISQHMNNNHNNSTTNLFRVDSLSSCLHNANPPPGIYGLENKIKVMQQYLFYLAFENQCVNDYITEKLWGPYEAGTIPIYYGAPNIKDHVPYHSFIHVTDYNTTNDLIQHLILIANNRTLYESYHKWRTEPIPYHFHMKYDITDTHSTCRTCRWAYARIHGIGWNHTTQSLRPLLNINSRLLCFDTVSTSSSTTANNDNVIVQSKNHHLLIQHPFIEEWVHTNANDDNTIVPIQPIILSSTTTSSTNNQKDNNNNNKGCKIPLDDTNRMIDIDNGKVQRTVYNHDGVIDMFVQLGYNNDNDIDINESKSSILRLRLKMPLLHDPIIFRPIRDNNNKVWQYQNDITRYTIIVVPAKSSSSTTTNQVVLQYDIENKYLYLDITNISIRIRIIVEDIDTVHDGAHEFENYFGRLMTNDFLYPIQKYVQLLPSTTSSSSS